MPQRLSQFRDSSELITSNIDVYLTDYGTITSNYAANAEIFRKAYNDVLSKRFSTNDVVTVYIYCPPGDYYFGDNPSGDSNFSPLTLNHPQGANVTIRSTVELNWANRPTNADLNDINNIEDRYGLLAGFYLTRFHFAKNGPVGRSPYIGLGTRGGGGFRNIGIFGRYGGSPGTFNKSTSFFGRGVSGSLRLENCCVHGFGGVTGSIENTNSLNGWGIGAEGNGAEIQAVNVQVVDCMRGYIVEQGGTIKTFGDCCVIHNKDSGITALDGGSVYFAGEGSGYISNYGNYGAHAYSGGIIRFGNTTSGSHTVAGGGIYSLRVDTQGIITGQSGKITYSNEQILRNGTIAFL
jgi:hypothetical protein